MINLKELKKILTRDVLDMLPFDISEQLQDLLNSGNEAKK